MKLVIVYFYEISIRTGHGAFRKRVSTGIIDRRAERVDFGDRKKYAAKIAEREVFLRSKIKESLAEDQFEEAEQIEDELNRELKSIRMRSESEKEEVRGN